MRSDDGLREKVEAVLEVMVPYGEPFAPDPSPATLRSWIANLRAALEEEG